MIYERVDIYCGFIGGTVLRVKRNIYVSELGEHIRELTRYTTVGN